MKNNFSIYVDREITLLAKIISAVLNINLSFLGNRFQFSYSWTFCSTTAGLDNCFRQVNEVTIKTHSGANQTTEIRVSAHSWADSGVTEFCDSICVILALIQKFTYYLTYLRIVST